MKNSHSGSIQYKYLFIIYQNWAPNYYAGTSAKLMIWRKGSILFLCLSLFFSFFLLQCYSQQNKTYIKTFQFNLTHHYYAITYAKLLIWRKENILLLCLSVLFFFFLLQCYSQHNKTYIKIFQFKLTNLQMLLMFMTLILQCSILHSITIFFYILYIIQFEKAINIQKEG